MVKDLMIVETGVQLDTARKDDRKAAWAGRMVEWPTGPVFFALNIDTPNRMDDLFRRRQ